MGHDPLPAIGAGDTSGRLLLHRASAPLRRPFRTSLRQVTHLDTLLVGIRDDEGRTGWGEAAEVAAVTGHDQRRVAATLRGPVATALQSAALEDAAAAQAAVTMAARDVPPAANAALTALLDLAARRRGLPVHRLLGASTDRLITTVTITRDQPAAMAEDAVARVAQGFTRLKLKLGARDPAIDIERVRTVARAVPRTRLLLDVNQGWNRATADDCIETLIADVPTVEAIEQPLDAADLTGSVALRRRLAGSGVELIADESVFSIADAQRIIAAGAADRINVKLAKAGGPAAARRILRLSHEHGVGTMLGCMLESGLGVASAAAVALAEGVTDCDLDAPLLLASSPVVGGPCLVGQELTVSARPGFGCVPRTC